MIVWSDPVDNRVYVGLADQLVLRLTTGDAARLRDELTELLGKPASSPPRGERPRAVDETPRRTAPTGK